jgi:hypothetical protein
MTAECKASDQPQAYQLQYEAAGKLFDDGDTEKCIAEAKRNLRCVYAAKEKKKD